MATEIYNKQGTRFGELVEIPYDEDSKTPPTYSHKFPVALPNGVVDERWSTKARPIKDLTHLLQGMKLRRYEDYMIDYDGVKKVYQYYFRDPKHALVFNLTASNIKQTVADSKQLKIVCEACGNHIDNHNIKWTK